MLLAHIVPLYAFIFQWIKSQFSLRFRKKIISRFLCPPSFPEEPFYFSSQETVQCAASVNLLSPEPLWLALGNTRELKLLSSSVSIIKLFFLKLIACSPGDPSHISGSSHSPKHTGYHCDLNRDCFCVKKKKSRSECWYVKSLTNDLVWISYTSKGFSQIPFFSRCLAQTRQSAFYLLVNTYPGHA